MPRQSACDPRPAGGGRATARITVDEAGLYRVSDGRLEALAAVGTLNPLEAAEVRATDERLGPIAEATGGAVLWLAETGIPDIRRVRPGRDLHGRNQLGDGGWIGLKANGDYVVRGAKQASLLPAGLVLVLGLGGLILAWRREGS